MKPCVFLVLILLLPTSLFAQTFSVDGDYFRVNGQSYYKDEIGLRKYIDQQKTKNPQEHKRLSMLFRESLEEADSEVATWKTRSWIAMGLAIPAVGYGLVEAFKRNDDVGSADFFKSNGNPAPYLIGGGVLVALGSYFYFRMKGASIDVDEFLKNNLKKTSLEKGIAIKKIERRAVPLAQMTFRF